MQPGYYTILTFYPPFFFLFSWNVQNLFHIKVGKKFWNYLQ